MQNGETRALQMIWTAPQKIFPSWRNIRQSHFVYTSAAGVSGRNRSTREFNKNPAVAAAGLVTRFFPAVSPGRAGVVR